MRLRGNSELVSKTQGRQEAALSDVGGREDMHRLRFGFSVLIFSRKTLDGQSVVRLSR